MTLSTTGVGTGLDIKSMVNKIVESERAPMQQRIDNTAQDVETDISAIGRLKASMNSMKDMMYAFRRENTFSMRSAASSQPDILFATANPQAVPSQYSVDVKQLAQSQKLMSNVMNPSDSLGQGEVSIALGTQSMSIKLSEDASLLSFVRLINSATDNPGVLASVVKDDQGTRLILSGNKTGADQQISVMVNAAPNSPLQNFAYEQANSINPMQQMQAPTDANIVLDGLASISSSTNLFNNVVNGVDINVMALTDPQTGPVIVSVRNDNETVRAAIDAFVNGYNAFYQEARALSLFDPNTQEAGPLVGDSLVRSSINQMRALFSTPLSNEAGSGINTLSQLGISTNLSGNLEINNAMLTRALEQNFSAVGDFFGGGGGFARKVEDLVHQFTGASGSIRNRENTLNEQKIRLLDDQTQLDNRMATLEKRTMQQFSAMENATASMKSQLAAMQNMLS